MNEKVRAMEQTSAMVEARLEADKLDGLALWARNESARLVRVAKGNDLLIDGLRDVIPVLDRLASVTHDTAREIMRLYRERLLADDEVDLGALARGEE